MSLPVGNFMHRYSRKGSPLDPEMQDRDRGIRTKLLGSGELQDQGAFGPISDRTLQSGVQPVKKVAVQPVKAVQGALPGVSAPVSDPAPVVQTDTNEFIAAPGETLFSQLGQSSKADRNLALALGGFKMAEAAGTPGATVLSALGKGGVAGVTAAATARKNAQDRALKQKLYDAKLAAAKGTAKNWSPEAKLVADLYPNLKRGTPEFAAKLQALVAQNRVGKGRAPTQWEQSKEAAKGRIPLRGPNETVTSYERRVLKESSRIFTEGTLNKDLQLINELAAMEKANETHTFRYKQIAERLKAKNINITATAQIAAANAAKHAARQEANRLRHTGLLLEMDKSSYDWQVKVPRNLAILRAATRDIYSGKIVSGKGSTTITSTVAGFDRIGLNLRPILSAAGIKVGDNNAALVMDARTAGTLVATLVAEMGRQPTDKDAQLKLKSLAGLHLPMEVNYMLMKAMRERIYEDAEYNLQMLESNTAYEIKAKLFRKQLNKEKAAHETELTKFKNSVKRDILKIEDFTNMTSEERLNKISFLPDHQQRRIKALLWTTPKEEIEAMFSGGVP